MWFARAGLVLEGRAGAIAWDIALDVDGVRVVVGVLMRAVRHFYVAVTKDGELEGFPLRSLLAHHVGVEYVHYIGRGEFRHRYPSM
jgi:hypothetical protein